MTFPPTRREPVKPVLVWYLCKVPGCTGTMCYTGCATHTSITSNYLHACGMCGKCAELRAVSGEIQYETDEDHA